jgi:hypothetical protein
LWIPMDPLTCTALLVAREERNIMLRVLMVMLVVVAPSLVTAQPDASHPVGRAAAIPARDSPTTGPSAPEVPVLPQSLGPVPEKAGVQKPTEPKTAASRPLKAVIARWLDLQTATLNLRYRYVDTSAGVVTTNQLQHREALRGRVKFDAGGQYALNFGLFTGVRFSSGWDNTGWGINDAQKNIAFKALFASAQPWKGVEGQLGGLYIIKGESTELTTYDEDGYITGERITIRRPDVLFLDEVSVTSAYFVGGTGPANIPISKRLPHIDEQNYQQYLLDKKIGKRVAASLDYTRESGRTTWRQAINLKMPEAKALDSAIVEVYQRTHVNPDRGFAVTLEKAITRKLTVNGGYASIDPRYGPLNADRFNIGNRAFVMTTYNFSPQLLASFFITTAVGENGVLPQRTLSNTVVTYNLLPILRQTGMF